MRGPVAMMEEDAPMSICAGRYYCGKLEFDCAPFVPRQARDEEARDEEALDGARCVVPLPER